MHALLELFSVSVNVADKAWRIVVPESLREAVVDHDGALLATVADALERELTVIGRGPYRTGIDAASVLFGLVVDPNQGLLRLGSPTFASERFLAAITGVPADFAAFGQAWVAADPHAAPFDIDQVAGLAVTSGLIDNGVLRHLDAIETRTRQLAIEVAAKMSDYRAPILESLSQVGLGLQADYAVLRVHALRFVALLPSLDHDHEGIEVQRLLAEMLRRVADDSDRAARAGKSGELGPLPGWMQTACRAGAAAVPHIPAAWVAGLTRTVVKRLAGIFIAGETIDQARDALDALASTGRSATLDQLGELVISETEADSYLDRVLELVNGSAARHGGARNDANVPLGHVSVKVSALCAHFDPDDVEGTWRHVGSRLLAIFGAAHDGGVFIQLDAEHYAVRNLTFEMMKRALRADERLWQWPDIGIVVQAYLVDSHEHLADVLAFCRERGVVMPIRLVKGAYWDEETTGADAHGFDAPQFMNKCETDICFRRLSVAILQAGKVAQLCIGSHNLRDHCFARAVREIAYPDAPDVEHQALHRTYEALSTGMARAGWAVRNYIPVGSLLVGMAYLVRRVMENSSQVGVLTMARKGIDLTTTLTTPRRVLGQLAVNREAARRETSSCPDPLEFVNVAPARLYRPGHRDAFDTALETFAAKSLPFAPKSWCSGEDLPVTSPSTGREIGRIASAAPSDVDRAVSSAAAALPAWAETDVGKRAGHLCLAAELMRVRRLEYAALVAFEAGKARAEALGDVDEAIDFLQFYGREALRRERSQGDASRQWHPRGVVAVVAPWNFPLAIPAGMATAALVAGNTVILKSAEQTPLIAQALTDLLHESGVPADAFIHLPGGGPEVGAPLVRHPRAAGCVFTGSKAVGTMIHRQLATQPGAVDADDGRLVITEMGGKNAVVVTANADLDEAVSGCLYAAFGHAGQKCSAASRVLVDERVADIFASRFAGAIANLEVGDAIAHGTYVNAVISAEDADRLRKSAQDAAQECGRVGGRVLADRTAEFIDQPGNLVGPAAFLLPASAAQQPESVAQRELFGPIVHVIPYTSLDEAVALFNGTEYALTGGIYAQSGDDVDWLVARLACGNLYVNRPNTAARVAIEPFGGFRMSGTGPKAGGRHYLDAFYRPAFPTGPVTVPAPVEGGGEAQAHITVRASARAPNPSAGRLAVARLVAAADALRGSLDHRAFEVLQDCGADLLKRAPVFAAELVATRSIPGQETDNHHDFARGPVVALVAADAVRPHALAHVLAALACGNAARVIAVSDAIGPWSALGTAATHAGISPDLFELIEVTTHEAAVSAIHSFPAATVVCDGAVHRWHEVIEAAGGPRSSANLWAIYDEPRGPATDDIDGLLRCHSVVRTVAVNTMRHGAPLSLD